MILILTVLSGTEDKKPWTILSFLKDAALYASFTTRNFLSISVWPKASFYFNVKHFLSFQNSFQFVIGFHPAHARRRPCKDQVTNFQGKKL